MSRIPELERELVAAANRRYGTATARRRLPSLRGLRVLLPVAAAALLAILVVPGLRGTEPEMDVPPASFAPSTRPTVDEFLRSPLRGLVDRSMVDARVAPLVMTPTTGSGGRWVVAMFAGRDGKLCVSATPRDPEKRYHGGTSCGLVESMAAATRARRAGLTNETIGPATLVYGVLDESAREVRVGPDGRLAGLSSEVLRVGEARLRLYYAEFRRGELTPGVDMSELTTVTYADGERRRLSP